MPRAAYICVAHTANDAVDVFDAQKYLFSIPDLRGVAGGVGQRRSRTSSSRQNRAENTVGLFALGPNPEVTRIKVGVGPNGLAYDHGRKLLLAAMSEIPLVQLAYRHDGRCRRPRRARRDRGAEAARAGLVFDAARRTLLRQHRRDPAVIAVIVTHGNPTGSPTCSPRPRPDRTASISTRRRSGCSAPAMPTHWPRWMPAPHGKMDWAPCPSAAHPT